MKYNWILVLLICSIGCSIGVRAQGKGDDVTGIWLTHGDRPARVQIYRSGQRYYGKIVALLFKTKDGKPQLDEKNPDKRLQGQPVLGLQILTGFRFDGDEWEDGHVYDPESGKTYSCMMSLRDKNTLKVRGYVGVSWMGRTEVWTRVQ